MIKFDPNNQTRYDYIVAKIRRLQDLLGLKPKTIEQRHQVIIKREQEKLELQKLVGQRRDPPKWKV